MSGFIYLLFHSVSMVGFLSCFLFQTNPNALGLNAGIDAFLLRRFLSILQTFLTVASSFPFPSYEEADALSACLAFQN